jgi:drug/metabolite transporter (DMT)-like permease
MGGIVRVSQIQLLQIFITLGASIILLDEKLDLQMIIFALLVVGIVLIGKKMTICNIYKLSFLLIHY